jgi:hypothetical protein
MTDARQIVQLAPNRWRVTEHIGHLRIVRTTYAPPEGWTPPQEEPLPEGMAALRSRPPRAANRESNPIDSWEVT